MDGFGGRDAQALVSGEQIQIKTTGVSHKKQNDQKQLYCNNYTYLFIWKYKIETHLQTGESSIKKVHLFSSCDFTIGNQVEVTQLSFHLFVPLFPPVHSVLGNKTPHNESFKVSISPNCLNFTCTSPCAAAEKGALSSRLKVSQ